MASIDDLLNEINQELEDLNVAEQEAASEGLGLGDYDLQTRTSQVRASRIAAEREQEEKVLKSSEIIESPVEPPAGDTPPVTAIQYEEREAKPKEEVNISKYNTALQKFKEAQSKLTPELLRLFPEAKNIYDTAISQGLEDRYNTFQNIQESYQLTPEQARKILGEQGYEDYIRNQGIVSSHFKEQFPEISSTAGKKEKIGQQNLYGLRTALLYQFKGEPRTPADVSKDVEWYKTKFGQRKIKAGE